jgi:hypothetical protein
VAHAYRIPALRRLKQEDGVLRSAYLKKHAKNENKTKKSNLQVGLIISFSEKKPLGKISFKRAVF